MPAAVAEAATAEGVVVPTEEVSAVAVSTGAAFMVVGSMGAASAVALSTAVAFVVAVSVVALSTAVAFVVAVSVVAVSTVAAFAVTVLVITDSLMMSSSAASTFLGGGAGAIRTITAITRTITMVMDTADIRTATADIRMATMDTADTGTTTAPVMDIADMGTTTAPVTDTSMAADQGIPGVCGGGDKPRLRLSEIAGLLMPVDQVRSIRRVDTQTGPS